MNSWPTIDREPVDLPVLPGLDDRLWLALIELAEVMQGAWTLIGGQMVLLHSLENEAQVPRVSTDIDVLVDARVVVGGIREFVNALDSLGFDLAGASPDGLSHRYVRDGVGIDVLAPEGLGPRTDLTTTPPGRTLEVPGGSQALSRTEFVPVRFQQSTGYVPRPSLLGAMICKAVAVDVDDAPNTQRTDLALLLSLVGDPLILASELTPKDKARLRKRSEMRNPEHPAWRTLNPNDADRGRAAYRLLTR
ncbi:MAG: hypothetical protein F4015_01160 [Acidimicrobiia bacterium]|nr:hypothetical protein [Acidimicrobiia bacterium]